MLEVSLYVLKVYMYIYVCMCMYICDLCCVICYRSATISDVSGGKGKQCFKVVFGFEKIEQVKLKKHTSEVHNCVLGCASVECYTLWQGKVHN